MSLRRFELRTAAIFAGALGLIPFAASAQDAPGVENPEPVCSSSIRASDGQLVVVCGENGFLLGNATSHSLTNLSAEQAAIIEVAYGDDRRVWLATNVGEEGFALEEISGAIAKAVGRGTTLDLSDVKIGLRPAADRASVVATERRASGAASTSAVSIDVSALAGRARQARLQARSTGPTSTGDAE